MPHGHGSHRVDVDVPRDERAAGQAAVLAGDAAPHRRLRPAAPARSWCCFLVLSVVMAVLAVATPVLAGRVVDAIVDGDDSARRHPARRCSSRSSRWPRPGSGCSPAACRRRIGEGLILDLRTAVFDHVQRMPVAFFTRTRTGALVSRLNNDVIGAQRAFSDTLSGRASATSSTLLLTARRDAAASPGRSRCWRCCCCRSSCCRPGGWAPGWPRLEREAANHNAAMSTQMTERFSAPGRDAGQAVRPAGARVGGVRRPGRAGCATSASGPRWCSRCSSPR